MKRLFMISIGGSAEGTNIEIHDVQFVAADKIEDTYDILKKNWYGMVSGLHLDSYMEVKGTDGYQIELTEAGSEGDNANKDLYFAHIGGYLEDFTQEIHTVGFVVSDTKEEAKKKALDTIPMDCVQKHVDSLVKVSDVIVSDDGKPYSLVLKSSELDFGMAPDWYGYQRIDK